MDDNDLLDARRYETRVSKGISGRDMDCDGEAAGDSEAWEELDSRPKAEVDMVEGGKQYGGRCIA